MKKAFLIVTLFILGSLFCFAQESAGDNESIYYPKSMYIAKVYPHKLGWKIDYYRDDNSRGSFYAPVEWFRESGGIGQITYGTGPSYPYVTFFFQDGKLHHFRLFLIQGINHKSYGVLDQRTDYSEQFNVDELDISFFQE